MTVQPIFERVIIKPANTIRIDRIGIGADCAACSVGSAYANWMLFYKKVREMMKTDCE